ncbi:MAG: type II toxin-antitoxin system PemK/MazF family toxin [Dokdonella sp.]
MKRGDICIVSGGKDYSGKPRPVVIVQDDSFDATNSITVCPLTSHGDSATHFIRLPVEPSASNGLRSACFLMIDKITTVAKSKIGVKVGRLNDAEIIRLNQAIVVFLGLAVSPRGRKRVVE